MTRLAGNELKEFQRGRDVIERQLFELRQDLMARGTAASEQAEGQTLQ